MKRKRTAFYLLKTFNVFNVQQMDNVPALAVKTDAEINEIALNEQAEHILKASGAKIIHHDISRAFYNPRQDEIRLPQVNSFVSTTEYYGTALHELGHWTGHSTRLNRDLTGSFGTEGYAKEELRAELASAFLSAELGLPGPLDNHASYVQSWLKVLRNDKREIFKASADAQKIATYVKDLTGVELNIQLIKEQIKAEKQNDNELKSDMQTVNAESNNLLTQEEPQMKSSFEFESQLDQQFEQSIASTNAMAAILTDPNNFIQPVPEVITPFQAKPLPKALDKMTILERFQHLHTMQHKEFIRDEFKISG